MHRLAGVCLSGARIPVASPFHAPSRPWWRPRPRLELLPAILSTPSTPLTCPSPWHTHSHPQSSSPVSQSSDDGAFVITDTTRDVDTMSVSTVKSVQGIATSTHASVSLTVTADVLLGDEGPRW